MSRLAEIGTSTSNARVAAVSAVAGGLAVSNGVDAAKDVAKTLKDGAGSLGVTVSASLGFSKSKSTSASTDQTVVASTVSGGDVNITATGAGATGSIKVIGSDVTATNNLTVLGAGPITFAAAQETDTSSGKSSSFGVSLGVSAGVGLEKGKLNTGVPSVNFGISGSKGSFAGTDVTNREATLSAGGTATVGTPGALTLDGAILSAKRVEIDAGSLAIASRQDTSTFASKDKSAGVNVSVTFTGQVSASGNLSTGKQAGDFASVETQAGIRAGEDGFGIRVAGATDLKGAVIASTADAARNQLTTGTLTATELANRETFKATSTSIGAGLGANLGKDRQGTINTDQSGNKLPGIKTGIGTLSATLPAALSASGSQSSTTVSAIASGGITVTSGDTASLGVAQTISRDTSGASADAAALLRQPADSALTKQFDDAKRTEIAQGFEATRQLVSEVGTFFANRGREEADLRKAADEAKARGDITEETRLSDAADKLRSTFGAGSAFRIGATALTGAASANVNGGLGSLVQGAAVNVLQSLAVTEVKKLADGIQGDAAARETVRAALQAVVGCAGASAGGSGGCRSAAIGAAASVVLNHLINAVDKDKATVPTFDANGNLVNPLSIEDQEARSNLGGTLIAAIATGAGLDAVAATTAGLTETQNNQLAVNGNIERFTLLPPNATPAQIAQARRNITAYFQRDPEGQLILAAAGGDQALAEGCLVNATSPACRTVQARLTGLRDTRNSQIDALAGSDPARREALSRLSPTELADAANFRAHFDQLSPRAQELVRQDIQNYDPNDPVANAASRLVIALFGEENVRAAYFATNQGGADFRDLGTGIREGTVETLSPLGRILRDVAIVGSEYDPNTGQRNPLFDTPEGQATLNEARARNSERFTTLANGAGNAAAGIGRLAADLAPPPWAGPNGEPLYSPTRAEVDAYNARVTRGVNTISDGIGNTVVAALTPIANVVDNCLVGNTPNACGRSIAPAAVEVGAAVLTDGAATALRNGGSLVDNIPNPPRSPLGNLDDILPNPNTRVLSGTEANALNTPNRGVIYVQENSSMSQAARDFQSGCTGAFCDPVSGRDAAPALRFDNNVTNGNNYIRFDGIERSADGQGIVLIDRKLKLADFNDGARRSTEQTFERVAAAVRQNPGYQVVYEFPNAATRRAADIFIARLVVEKPELRGVVTTRVAGPR